MKEILIPVGDDSILLTVNGNNGCIKSTLKDATSEGDNPGYDAAIDGLESLILCHACAGINVEDPKYIEGIVTAVDAISNNL